MTFTTSSGHLGEALMRAQLHSQQRLHEEGGSPFAEGAPTAFTIAISREAGASGSAVAAKLGERLGWPVYDRELLRHIAESLGMNTRHLESVDEKRPNWLMNYLEAFAAERDVSVGAYLYGLSKAVLSLAAHGKCIFVGRGVAQFLPAESTVRVRLVAPLEHRIAVVQKRHGVSREEAARRVASTDLDRTTFVREHFHKDPNDPALYDLVLNTGRFTVEETAEMIEQALHRLQTPKPAAVQAALAG
jgi:cytidylate kinase